MNGRWRGFAVLAAVFAVLALLRGAWLLHAHSLNSIDGALQTWFAADHFARGEALGTAFQSYLGITMVLALLPVFVLGGKTLFASTLAAYTMVLAGAFATARCRREHVGRRLWCWCSCSTSPGHLRGR